MEIKGSLCHQLLINNNKPLLSYKDGVDFNEWRAEVKQKAIELLGLDKIAKNNCPPNLTIEEDVQKETYRRIRFVVETEYGAFCPCYLLIPNTKEDIFEFMLLASSNFDAFYYATHLHVEDISDAWLS